MFRIGAIRIQGTRARPETDVGAAAGLAAGEIYTQSAVAAARTRIESSYRRAGYTAARVTARSTPDDAAASVAVRFDLVEGPRQVVDTVVVDGGSRTNPGLVALALRVDPGNPHYGRRRQGAAMSDSLVQSGTDRSFHARCLVRVQPGVVPRAVRRCLYERRPHA